VAATAVYRAGLGRFGVRIDAHGLFHGLRPPPGYRLKN